MINVNIVSLVSGRMQHQRRAITLSSAACQTRQLSHQSFSVVSQIRVQAHVIPFSCGPTLNVTLVKWLQSPGAENTMSRSVESKGRCVHVRGQPLTSKSPVLRSNPPSWGFPHRRAHLRPARVQTGLTARGGFHKAVSTRKSELVWLLVWSLE